MRVKKSKKDAKPEPLWKGPEVDGVTQSMISRFLVCRERFRLNVIEGLRPNDQFNHRIEYGQMWHTCEEALASGVKDWGHNHALHAQLLCKRYPLSQEQIQHWYNVCKVQFPLYVNYWNKQPDVLNRTPLLQEEIFDVPYTLPSGRVVRLRGKWDAVDLIGKGKDAGVYLQENKSKGDIDETQLRRQVGSGFDLQTMLYLVALEMTWRGKCPIEALGSRIKGVRYNVVRRPLSGGKGSIVRHKPTKSNPRGESEADFYSRLSGIISESPETYFMRWKIEITPGDVVRFRRECLDPILEQLCTWYSWITANDPAPEEWGYGINWRHPYGVFNVLDDGGSSDLDAYLDTGSEVGLTRIDSLFGELK